MRRVVPLIIVVLLGTLLSACSTAGKTTLPPITTTTSTSASTSVAPLATAAPTDEAPAASSTTQGTKAPTAVSPVASPSEQHVILWHSFAEDSREQQTLNSLLASARQRLPQIAVAARLIPGDQLIDRFAFEAAAGGGPDLIIAPNDRLVRIAQAELLRRLDSDIAAQRASYAPSALESMTVDGKLYGVPLSRSTVALYYNRSKLPSAPATTEQLIEIAKAGTKVVLVRSAFHNVAFFGAFGGRLLDEQGRCVADAGGVAAALAYLRELKTAGAHFVSDGAGAETLFKTGEAEITINGSWLLSDFRAALGNQLGVAPVPAGPGGPARPLIGASGLYLNANSANTVAAVALALDLTRAEAQQAWADEAGQLPANPDVAIADDAVGGLAAAALTGQARPLLPERDAVWPAFDGAIAAVLEQNADPSAVVQDACSRVNQINGR